MRPHATSAPALTQFDSNNSHAKNTHSGQLSQPMARPHTQQDASYARGHHATTRTFAERVNSSAARNASTLGPNKCHKFGAGMPKGPTINVPPPQKTKLDFGNLFADQPDIGYFPVLKTGSGARTASRGASRSVEGAFSKQLYQPQEEVDWSKEYLASSKRVNSSAQLGVTGDGNNTDGYLNRTTRTADSALDTFRMPSGFLNTGEGEAGDMGMGQRNIAPGQFDPVPMYPLYPSNGSIGSTSYLSENRSIVHNKSAVVSLCIFFCLFYFLLLSLGILVIFTMLCLIFFVCYFADADISPSKGVANGINGGQDHIFVCYRDSDQPSQDAPRIAEFESQVDAS